MKGMASWQEKERRKEGEEERRETVRETEREGKEEGRRGEGEEERKEGKTKDISDSNVLADGVSKWPLWVVPR